VLLLLVLLLLLLVTLKAVNRRCLAGKKVAG
jgi:hypothetical protein